MRNYSLYRSTEDKLKTTYVAEKKEKNNSRTNIIIGDLIQNPKGHVIYLLEISLSAKFSTKLLFCSSWFSNEKSQNGQKPSKALPEAAEFQKVSKIGVIRTCILDNSHTHIPQKTEN